MSQPSAVWSRCVHGIDFSGAEDAGARIWIASGDGSADRLRIVACRPASDLPGSGHGRSAALAALGRFIAGQTGSAVGLDVPFSLPAAIMDGRDWPTFITTFAQRWPDADTFRATCRARAQGRELRRRTDAEAGTPFSPYNLRLYRQTFYGLRDLLAPLLAEGQVCALPMQPARPGTTWLLEVCPASTLEAAGMRRPYKGRSRAHRSGRQAILTWLAGQPGVTLPAAIADVALVEHGGDALDSLIAAVAVWRTLHSPDTLAQATGAPYALEGYVYR